MSNIGAGSGSSYPASIDIQTTPEVNSPSANKTKARAEVPNDLAAAVIAVETALGTNPQGITADVKTFLQTEHGTNGVHLTTKVVTPATFQAGTAIYAVDTGVADAYVATLNPALASLTVGQVVRVKISNANASITPTLNVSGLGANTIVKYSAYALNAGDLPMGYFAIFQWTGTWWDLLNPFYPQDGTVTTAKIVNNAVTNTQLGAGAALANIGAGGVTQTYLAASSVGQGQLKTATGSVSGITSDLILPGGEYGFYPRIWGATTAALASTIANAISSLTAITNIYLNAGVNTAYASQRYIQASPPYMLGNIRWGHFIFLLRNVSTGQIVAGYEAEDPCWAYNGPPLEIAKKDSVARIQAVPHPFFDYSVKDPLADGLEIILLDLRNVNMDLYLAHCINNGQHSILQDIKSIITGTGTYKKYSDYLIPSIPNFTDKVKIITP